MIDEKHLGTINYDTYSDSFMANCSCGFSGKPNKYRFRVSDELYKHFDKNKKQGFEDLIRRVK